MIDFLKFYIFPYASAKDIQQYTTNKKVGIIIFYIFLYFLYGYYGSGGIFDFPGFLGSLIFLFTFIFLFFIFGNFLGGKYLFLDLCIIIFASLFIIIGGYLLLGNLPIMNSLMFSIIGIIPSIILYIVTLFYFKKGISGVGDLSNFKMIVLFISMGIVLYFGSYLLDYILNPPL